MEEKIHHWIIYMYTFPNGKKIHRKNYAEFI